MTVHVAPGANRVRADRRVIKHTLANLLSNAVKFTGPNGRIDVNAWAEGDTFVFEIVDDGTGIDPALMPHLTDLFRHADQAFTRKHEGMGAGLYLVKRFVTLLNGSLSFQSELGKGTRVRVALPGAAVPESAQPAADEAA
jgi:signal transduction histidine kinase